MIKLILRTGKAIPGGRIDILDEGVLIIAEVYPDSSIRFINSRLEKRLVEQVLMVANNFELCKANVESKPL